VHINKNEYLKRFNNKPQDLLGGIRAPTFLSCNSFNKGKYEKTYSLIK
jgi:hypothetical protein